MGSTAGESEANGRVEEPTIAASLVVEEQAQLEGSSDGEGERSARERLKKTSIAGLAQKSTDTTPPPGEPHPLAQSTLMEADTLSESGTGNRGRPAKKRSFEDLTRGDSTMEGTIEPPLPKSGHHKRLRSRDLASGEHVVGKYEADASNSVREESDLEAEKSPGGPGILVEAALNEDAVTQEDIITTEANTDSRGEPAKAEEKPEDTEAGQQSTIKPTSRFANTSTKSPFGSLPPAGTQPFASISSSKTTSNPTTSSAFASSGLSAFAASEKSPFSTAETKSSGGFGGAATTGSFATSTSGGFGQTTTASPFASKGSSGFGSGGGFGASAGFGSSAGFGAPKPFGTPKTFGSGISSFAGSSGGPGTFGTSKPIGTSKDEDEDASSNNEDDDDENDKQTKEDAQDDRFHEQDVATGEEEEQTIFSCRAKLYHFEKEWKERGVGTIKINVRHVETTLSKTASNDKASETEEGREKGNKSKDFSGDDIEAGLDDSFATTERRARLIMRTDGVHRVILNTPVFKDMRVGQQDGSEPVGKTMHLTGMEEGKLRSFQIKIGKEEVLRDLYWKVLDLQTDLA